MLDKLLLLFCQQRFSWLLRFIMVSTIKLSLSFSKCTKPHWSRYFNYLYYPKSSHTYTLDFSSQYLDNTKGGRCLKNNNNKFHSDVTICFVDKDACVTLCSTVDTSRVRWRQSALVARRPLVSGGAVDVAMPQKYSAHVIAGWHLTLADFNGCCSRCFRSIAARGKQIMVSAAANKLRVTKHRLRASFIMSVAARRKSVGGCCHL